MNDRDWCCMTRTETAWALAADVPHMTGEEIGWLPRPVQAAAAAVQDAAARRMTGAALAATALITL